VLRELVVTNLGVIKEISADFSPGMVALTGETGAGKTLVVEALGLLFGGRAGSGLVRRGASSARVEGRFEVPSGFLPHEAMERFGLDPEVGSELVLRREVPADGRSRGWVNGSMATASEMASLGSLLLEIHGQHDHVSLLSTSGQRQALDCFAGTDLGPLRSARAELKDIEAALAELGGDPGELQREADFLAFQLHELESAAIGDPEEEARLAEEEDALAGAESHRQAAAMALEAIVGGQVPGASDRLGEALATLGGHRPFMGVLERIRALFEELRDAAAELREAAEKIEDDPARLAEVRERRRLLADIARKYGGSLEDARAFAETARSRLDSLSRRDAEASELVSRRQVALEAVRSSEAEVRKVRARAASCAGAEITAALRQLAMPAARVEVSVGEAGPGDEVVFLLGANPGEPLMPLSKVASGGELARATLAVRLVTSGGPPTLVFDEVDAGIGGEAALAVGKALSTVARDHQVVVVTHLAQVAAFADQHLVVAKSAKGGRTVTEVREASGRDRVVELARMLSGQPDSEAAQRHAEELLARAAELRSALPRDGREVRARDSRKRAPAVIGSRVSLPVAPQVL
jgi:DNA repair protein RecN (Recombination protein N)